MSTRENSIAKTILIVSMVLVVFAFTFAPAVACNAVACNAVVPGELIDHVAHLASDVCAMASSIRLMTFAVIGLFVVSAVSLIVSLAKK